MKNKSIYLTLLFNLFSLLIANELFSRSWIIFYADDSSLTGHAFVSFVREDPQSRQKVLEGCWGFYPKSGLGVWGEVEGAIKNDITRQIDIGFRTEVSDVEFNTCLAKKKEWESKKYSLTQQNCVDFIKDIAGQIPKLVLPNDGNWFPINYVKFLKLLNENVNPCPAHPDVIENYSADYPRYHTYTVVEEVCDNTLNPCCSQELVFKIMASSAEYIAPYAGSGPVIDCGLIQLVGFGHIVTRIDPANSSITNYTKKDHLLYVGKVTRFIEERNGKVYVRTIGVGNNEDRWDWYINKNQTNAETIWGIVNKKLREEVQKQLNLYNYSANCAPSQAASLFLFDVSGSMNEAGASGVPKIAEARAAAMATLQQMNQQRSVAQEIGLTTFSGDCLADPLNPAQLQFTRDWNTAVQGVQSLPPPYGGTPLPQAIASAEAKFITYLAQNQIKQGRLIILSDGESTCGPIRPADVYAFGQRGQVTRSYGSGPGASGAPLVKYYTVGFNITPGSSAERDLQYLAQISGGKYLNAQNQFELARAFQKFNRFYVPKETPALAGLPGPSLDAFRKGRNLIENEAYPDALDQYREFARQHPDDCHGAYNLALMCEANDLYKATVTHYETYLALCPDAPDREEVLRRIELARQDYENYLEYNRKVVASDMAYLDYHFKKIQNGESVALAVEFIAFMKEKWQYYKNLAALLEIDTRPFKVNAQEVFRGFQECVDTIKRNPQVWDREATPVLSRTYFNMERLLSTLR